MKILTAVFFIHASHFSPVKSEHAEKRIKKWKGKFKSESCRFSDKNLQIQKLRLFRS